MFEKLNLLIPFGNFIRNKSIQNFLFLAIIQSSNVLISIISMPLLIQSIGVDQFGLVNLALSVIILLNILVGFGYNLSAPREVAILQGNKEALSHVVSNVFSGKVLLAALAAFMILIGVFGLNLFEGYQMILVFSVLLLFSEATLPLWFFQGMEKMKLVSIANIFSKLLFLMGIVLFIHSPEQSKWVNFLMGFFGLGINLLLLAYIHSFLGIQFYRPEFSAIWKSLKDNSLLFLSNLASHISINGGLIILSFFSVAETLGMYSLAERVIMVLRMFPALIIQAIFPSASRLFKENQTAFYVFLKRVYFRVLGIGAIISTSAYFSAPFIIKVLSRSELEESVIYLQILSIVPFLACLNIGNITIMLVSDLKQLLFRASWMMCAYMVTVSLILTSMLGAIGLCLAIASTEIVVFLICLVLLYRHNRTLVHGFYS
ncbi:MAG: oligosaccharide flippase family protein [Algoriphagus sp.]|uniref:oligosaccharide flippase family protein n=1 Tax=Algoriphagus sp. TaxID=1872435 RepID=UPI0027230C78|nr:oligosaccharide flippase family protein [Algoriphagus sp.]MDO8968917.1 oligosaccharide flippase family protein [Algoriphagus sp.]MDP2039889.1 oligosaccharide flippase family protein [Algoriphagus sp.]MDP3202071.1 oligosaccharide flippase family protein [Algoriphagus sp.]MDP3471249.1 oligosaccharide flippase family protein [Algoriphagus sp.]